MAVSPAQRPLVEGSSTNEMSTAFRAEGGAHVIRILERVSPDVIVVFQSKMVGFLWKTKATDEVLVPAARSVKDLILKDV